MDDREIRSLVGQCDCFVSLHRSEGFGRGLAEAMLMGKPVIATGYSGNLDFTNEENCCLVDYELVPVGDGEYPFGAGQLWAEADVDVAADFMRTLVNDPAFAREKGEAGARYIRRDHSFGAVGARYRRRLEQLGLVERSNP
jgi:glycosyltransferase involved in cell wall biosynthesis